ncbi:MAG: hypothetical protein U0586_03705 [Candidatus Brocadiaceae bacterium]
MCHIKAGSHKPFDAGKSIPAEVIKGIYKKVVCALAAIGRNAFRKTHDNQRAADVRDIIVMLEQWKKEFAKVLPDVRFKAQSSNRRFRDMGEKTTSSSGGLTSTGK